MPLDLHDPIDIGTSFLSGGERCAATLWHAAGSGERPGVVVVPG